MFGSKLHQSKASKAKPDQETVVETHKKLKAIKYPVKAISIAIVIGKKLSQLSKEIRPKLEKKMDHNINAYRQVRGDGNCFFRALAFSYITNKKEVRFQDIFVHIKDISLQACIKQTIPKDFQPYYNDALLKQIFKTYWEKEFNFFVQITESRFKFRNYKRALARLLTQNPFFDFIIILYFRAICLAVFRLKKEDFKDFLKGTEEQEISSYGEESQGVIMNLMAKYFKTDIIIYQIRKDQVVSYEYNEKKSISIFSNNNIYLLFYDNHYDVLENNPDAYHEHDDEKQDQDYYQSSSANFIKGTCIQCDKEAEVNEENGLCEACLNKSMANLDTFKKDKMVEGFCVQCNQEKKKVSEQLQICQRCLKDLQYSSPMEYSQPSVSQHDKPRTARTNFRCRQCKIARTTSEIGEDSVCYECLFPGDKGKVEEKVKQSMLKNSKMESESTSTQLTTLQNKIQSKLGKEERHKLEEEIKLRQEVQGLMRGKLFQRSKAMILQCKKCKSAFQSFTEIPDNEQFCKSCKGSSMVTTSMMKSNFTEPAGKPTQSSIKQSTMSKQSQSVEIKPNKFKCTKCSKPFQTHLPFLSEQQKICVNCLKQMMKSKVSATSMSGKDSLCQACKKPDEFYKLEKGICTKCRQRMMSNMPRRV